MKMSAVLLVVASVMAVGCLFADGNVLEYRGQGWESTWTRWTFNDPEAWLATTSSEPPYSFPGTGGTIADRNPERLIPGEGDLLYMSGWNKLNLGGEEFTIAMVSSKFKADDGLSANTGGNLYLTNGVLNVTDGIGPRYGLEIYNGATLRLLAGSEIHVSWGYGSLLPVNVHSGGRLELLGAFETQTMSMGIDQGGVCYFNPTRWRQHGGSAQNSVINVAGTLDAPMGFLWTVTAGSGGKGSLTANISGRVVLGGNFSRNGHNQAFPFSVNVEDGATIHAASNTVKFTDLTGMTFKQNATVALQADADAVLDVSEFAAESGVTLNKTGPGVLKIGMLDPEALNVTAGSVVLSGAVPSGLSVSSGAAVEVSSEGLTLPDVFAAGSALRLKSSETRIDSLAYLSDVSVDVDWSVISVGSVVMRSADAGVLAAMKTRLSPSLPEGRSLSISGDALRLVEGASYEFDATVSGDLSDLSAWGGLPEIPVGESVNVKGAGTVLFTASSPSFAGITVQEGATLSVVGGTESSPVVLPPVNLAYQAKLLVSTGSYAVLTNGFSTAANALELPVFEIATNATAFMTAPDYPASALKFKNVDIRLYGQLKLPMASWNSTQYDGNKVYFGTADAGETSYFAMTADGGTVYDPCNSSLGYVTWGGQSQTLFACPANNGRVHVVRDIVLRNYRKLPENLYQSTGVDVGWQNPVDEVFNLICEGDTVLVPATKCSFGGGARVIFRTGTSFDKKPEFNNNVLSGGVRVEGDARFVFEGDAWFQLPNTKYESFSSANRGDGANFNPSADDTPVVTLRNGAHLDIWRSFGNAKGIAEVEDGSWDVGQRAPVSSWMNTEPVDKWPGFCSTNQPAFNGFKAVNIALGGTLSIRATDTHESDFWRGWTESYRKWDRVTSVGAPLTGGGSLLVTNTLTDAHTLTVTVIRGDNTATGEAAASDTPLGRSYLKFADGANWAGTVVANGYVSLGNLSDDDPVTADFGSIRFAGAFPIRVWKTGQGLVNDVVNLSAAATGVGGFAVVPQNCSASECSEITVGKYPSGAPLPPTMRGWYLTSTPVADDPAKVWLRLRRRGLIISVR